MHLLLRLAEDSTGRTRYYPRQVGGRRLAPAPLWAMSRMVGGVGAKPTLVPKVALARGRKVGADVVTLAIFAFAFALHWLCAVRRGRNLAGVLSSSSSLSVGTSVRQLLARGDDLLFVDVPSLLFLGGVLRDGLVLPAMRTGRLALTTCECVAEPLALPLR